MPHHASDFTGRDAGLVHNAVLDGGDHVRAAARRQRDALVLGVQDIAESLANARQDELELLGVQREAQLHEEGDGHARGLGVGNAQVHLIVTPEGLEVDQPAPSLSPLASPLALTVDDYAEALGCVRERELEVIETTPEIGQLWVRDPDGHVIELITATARR